VGGGRVCADGADGTVDPFEERAKEKLAAKEKQQAREARNLKELGAAAVAEKPVKNSFGQGGGSLGLRV
jgi:hypothetical protein